MGPIEQAWASGITRRRALLALGGLLAGPRTLTAQIDPRDIREHRRFPSLDEMVDAFDFEPICFANMQQQAYDYMAQSTDSEWTKRRNRYVFDWVQLREGPRVEPETVDPSTEILGVPMAYPILVAPTANQAPLHPSAEAGMYQGTTAAGALMMVSNNATLSQEEIAAAATGPRWIQYYPSQNLDFTRQRLEAYQAAGALAIIVTVDQQATRYDRGIHTRWLQWNVPADEEETPPARQDRLSLRGPARYGLAGRLWYTWDHMSQLRDLVRVPMLIKGIMTAEDALICVQRGFDGVIVSNHGARSLDYTPSSLEVLPEIVQAVGGRIPVLIDSGFRRGSDVFKALALGADGVCFGRAARWGLGAFGPAGVQRLLEILQSELRQAMSITGRRTLAEIDETAVTTSFF